MAVRARTLNYVSILFPNLLQPIADLLSLMGDPEGPNEVQAARHENGYATAISLLGAVVIESVCNRARYITNDNGRKGPVETLRDLGAPDLADDVEEVFVLRDAIAHNHIWEAQIEDHETKGLTLIAAKMRAGYGDTKFNPRCAHADD